MFRMLLWILVVGAIVLAAIFVPLRGKPFVQHVSDVIDWKALEEKQRLARTAWDEKLNERSLSLSSSRQRPLSPAATRRPGPGEKFAPAEKIDEADRAALDRLVQRVAKE